jgi:hypothetical protein
MKQNLEKIYMEHGIMGMFFCEKYKKFKTRITFKGCIARQKFTCFRSNSRNAGYDTGCLDCETGVLAAEIAGVTVSKKTEAVKKTKEKVCLDCGAVMVEEDMTWHKNGVLKARRSYCRECERKRAVKTRINQEVMAEAVW